jgi:hypothetical protein
MGGIRTSLFIFILGVLLANFAYTAEPVAAEIAGPNLIKNGDFESPGEKDNCPFNGWHGRVMLGGQYAFKLGAGRTGKAALIEGTAAGRGDIHTTDGFTVAAGEMLRVRFWAKAENLKGGAFATLEGEPNDDGWHKINIDASSDWKLYEARVTVPKGAKGQVTPRILLWIYHFGTGALYIDDVSACVVKPDPAGSSRQELERMRGWLTNAPDATLKHAAEPLLAKLDAALNDPKPDAVKMLRGDVLAAISAWHGGDGAFALGVATSLDKIFLDEPYCGDIASALHITLARNEAESAQAVVLSAGKELSGISVELAGDLSGEKSAALPAPAVKLNLVGYVDTSKGERPYPSPKLGWWPDPLLPPTAFNVRAGELQPVWITVTTTAQTKAGTYSGKLLVKANGVVKATLPLSIDVADFTLPARPQFGSFALGSGAETVAAYYSGDANGKIMEGFAVEAAKRHLPPVNLINGWGWKTPKSPKAADGTYDFTQLDRWLDVLKPNGLTCFPMASAPRFRKFGGGDYTAEFKRELGAFIHAYAAHLKQKGVADGALFYNIDEASNDPQTREWDACKELYAVVKQAAPDVPVVQCLNEFKGVEALAGHADIWDLYFGQFDQAGGPQRKQAGDKIFLSVCVWPSEHPNLFIEYPALDARIMPWICHRVGAKGSEYWDLFAGWAENAGNTNWWKQSAGNGARTAWKLPKPHGDGLLMYPGPGGQPLSSIRLEAYRDGVDDFGYLELLAEKSKTDAQAAALLKEAHESLVTGVTSFNPDPKKLLDLRRRIAECLSKH